MSLVAEILASIKQRSGVEGSSVGGDGVCVEVAELSKRAAEAKVAVVQALQEQYQDLCSTLQDTAVLQTRVSHNLEQLEALQNSLSGGVESAVASSVAAVSDVAGMWQQAVVGLEVAQQLLMVHNGLRKSGKLEVLGRFLEAALELDKVEKLLSEIDTDVDIIPGIYEEVNIQRNIIINSLSQVWSQTFKWEEEMNQQDKKKSLALLIKCPQSVSDKSGGQARDMTQVLGALHLLGELHVRLQVLADNLMNNFFRVVMSRAASVSLREVVDSYSLSVKFSTAPDRRTEPPPPQDVFYNMEQLLKHLQQTVFGVVFQESDQHTTTLMRLLGEQVSTRVTELLISECLAAAVPCSRKNLHEFDAVKTATQNFHAMLVQIGFYSGSEASILDYAANVDSVFSTKACSHLLDTARSLIARPLHDTVTITTSDGYPPLVIQNPLPEDDAGVALEKSTLRLEKLMAAKTFHMPPCQVSKSICEVVDLVFESLEEACVSSPQYAGKLVTTVRNMLALYEHVTPVAHAHTLGTIPQHAALVHNNSMFISAHCYLLAHQYRNRLPEGLRDADPCSTSYTDLSYQITKVGTEVFCKAMQGHKKALLETIAQAQGFGEVPSATGVRQCLLQLQQLRNVWHQVLPHSVYTKAMGTLLNSVILELIERTLTLEDISADSAVTLIATLSVLKDNAPSLFPTSTPTAPSLSPPKDGVCGVRQWGRYQELIVVLGASLRELQDRWADGKGPLALYFTADQTKALVRALFQNTDRRAQLLARIKLN